MLGCVQFDINFEHLISLLVHKCIRCVATQLICTLARKQSPGQTLYKMVPISKYDTAQKKKRQKP